MRLKGSKVTSKFTLQRAKLPLQDKGREALLFSEKEPTTDKITENKRIESIESSIQEDILYTKFLDLNPVLGELVGAFNLVHSSTGRKPKRVFNLPQEAPETYLKSTLPDEIIRIPQPKIKRAKKETIAELTARLIEGFNSYTREEIIERIVADTGVDKERALKGFIKMRKDKAIFKTHYHTYYLSSSTPF